MGEQSACRVEAGRQAQKIGRSLDARSEFESRSRLKIESRSRFPEIVAPISGDCSELPLAVRPCGAIERGIACLIHCYLIETLSGSPAALEARCKRIASPGLAFLSSALGALSAIVNLT
jgi:hypothetical protein